MPVKRFRSIEEMTAHTEPGRVDADFDRFLRHCARYWALSPKRYPRGVFKFLTIEDAERGRSYRRTPESD